MNSISIIAAISWPPPLISQLVLPWGCTLFSQLGSFGIDTAIYAVN